MPSLLVPATLALIGTLVGCVRHAWASKVDEVAMSGETWRYRLMISWLHFVQPWARVRGRIKGYFSDSNFSDVGRALLANAPRLNPLDALKLTFFRLDESLWDTQYTTIDAVLNGLRKRAAGALTPVRCDDGFGGAYDMVLRAGRTYSFRLKLTAEDHGGMNRLFRARISLNRPWVPMFIASTGVALLTLYFLRIHLAMHSWMLPELALGVLLSCVVLARVSRHGGQVLHALRSVATEHGILVVGDGSATPEADQHRPALG
jgi:hypothetical protein